VVFLDWNRWSFWTGIGGLFGLEQVVFLDWNRWSFWIGIGGLFDWNKHFVKKI